MAGYTQGARGELNARAAAALLSIVMTGFSVAASLVSRDPWLQSRLAVGSGLAYLLGWISGGIAIASTIIAGPLAALANLAVVVGVALALNLGQAALGGILGSGYEVYATVLSTLRHLGLPFYLASIYAALVPTLALARALSRPRRRARAKASPAIQIQQPPRNLGIHAPQGSARPQRAAAPATAQAPASRGAAAAATPRAADAGECPRLSEWGKILSTPGGPRSLASCWLGREVYSYRIEEFIGAGGFGLVLKARSKYNVNDVVAIKIVYPVPPSGGGDKLVTSRKITEIAEEIHRESSSLQELSRRSPFIVRLHAIHLDMNVLRQALLRDDPAIYIENPLAIIMEYMGGGSLAGLLDDAISRYGSSSLRRGEHWARASAILVYTAAEALYTIHRSGYMHGDVKPQNVLFTSKPPHSPSELAYTLAESVKSVRDSRRAPVLPKLSDLGSAVRLSEPVASFTPLYAPPELLEYDAKCSRPGARYKAECLEQPKASPQIDIYSLGLIALQLFAALRNKDLTAWRHSGQLDTRDGVEAALSSLGVPRLVSDFIASMLDPDPKSRPTTKEVVEFFKDYARV